MVSVLALAKPEGFFWVSHNVSIDIFERVDEQLSPLLPVLSLGEFGSLGCVHHGCYANPILLFTQTAQQVGHILQRGGDQWGVAVLGRCVPGGWGFALTDAPSCNKRVE